MRGVYIVGKPGKQSQVHGLSQWPPSLHQLPGQEAGTAALGITSLTSHSPIAFTNVIQQYLLFIL